MSKFLFALIAIMLLIIPGAMAANITITAEPLGGSLNIAPPGQSDYTVDVSALQRNAIQRITVDIPTGSTVDYTLWYGNGTMLSGQSIYHSAPGMCGIPIPGVADLCQYSSVSIGGSTSDHYYVGVEETGRLNIVGYGRNEDTGQAVAIIYDLAAFPIPLHLPGDAMAYTSMPSGVFYKFHISSNKQITSLNYYTNTEANVLKAKDTSLLDILDEWLSIINQIKDSVIEFFWLLYYGFEFFWDNWNLIFALYIVITGAVCFCQAKSIFGAVERWFGYQRKLVDFVIGIFVKITGIISQFL